MTDRLPELLDCKALRAELGITRAAAEAIMRRPPIVQVEGLRKTFVRRSDVAAYLESRTFTKSEVPQTDVDLFDRVQVRVAVERRCLLNLLLSA